MYIFKYLIGSALAFFSSISGERGDGWYSVERQRKGIEQSEEVDLSIWVLFSKQLGSEKIWLRFPEDPIYREGERDEYEFLSEKDGESFQLFVKKESESALIPNDLTYLSEGKWVREHFVQKGGHFYHFKTVTNDPQGVSHNAFVSSFSIEKSS